MTSTNLLNSTSLAMADDVNCFLLASSFSVSYCHFYYPLLMPMLRNIKLRFVVKQNQVTRGGFRGWGVAVVTTHLPPKGMDENFSFFSNKKFF